MGSRVPKSSLFKKYILSYLIVFSIPLIFFLVVINNVYIQNLQEEREAANQTLLEQASLQLDEQIMEMNAIGNQIKYSATGYLPMTTSDDAVKYAEYLKTHDISARSTDGIYIVLPNQNKVISHKGAMSLSALLHNTIDFEVMEQERLIEELSSPTEKISVYSLNRGNGNAGTRKKVFYYMMPLRGAGDNQGTLVFVMNTDSVSANLETMRGAEGEISYIIDGQGDVLISRSEISDLSRNDLYSVTDAILTKGSATINKADYIASSKTNSLTGWTLVSLVEARRFYLPLYRILLLLALFIFGLALIGTIVSYYFATKHYRPIKRLTNSFLLDGDNINDELLFLQTNISRTKLEKEKLNRLMNDQAPVVRNAALLNLIEGKHLQDEKFLSSLTEIGLQFPHALFSLLIIEFKELAQEAEKVINIEKVVQALNEEEAILEDIHLEAVVPYLRNDQILIIVNMQKNSKQQWDRVLTFIEDQVDTENPSERENWHIAIGNTYDSLLKVKNAYIEATLVLEKPGLENQPSNTHFFNDLMNKTSNEQAQEVFQYPQEELMLLLQSIKKGNKTTSLEMLDQLFETIDASIHISIAKQAVIADVFNNILQLTVDMDMSNQYEKIYSLNDFANTKTTKPVLAEIVISSCDRIQEREQTQSTEIKQQVVDYIYENYASPDISLSNIAAVNNISISYVSRLIKEETGESFSNMVQTLRMNRFKELLIESSDSIKDLITQIGYYDASNFTRKFRKENGITPSEYRNLYQTNA